MKTVKDGLLMMRCRQCDSNLVLARFGEHIHRRTYTILSVGAPRRFVPRPNAPQIAAIEGYSKTTLYAPYYNSTILYT